MRELLKLCGFEDRELAIQLPRIEKVFERLHITPVDIERGKQRLHKYHDIELEGVRKAYRLCILDVVNTMLARDEGKKKIIYAFMAPGYYAISSALMTLSTEVYSAHFSWAFEMVLSCIFDKIAPVLEEAEKRWLKTGMVAHCGNVKTFLGLVTSVLPKPDLLVTSGALCETAPKTLDLLHELYGIQVHYYDTCQDRELADYSRESERITRLSAESLRKLVERVQEVVGFEITDGVLRDVLEARDRLENASRRLRELIQNSDPLPISASNMALLNGLSQLSLDIDGLQQPIDVINTVYRELKERVDKGLGAVEKGAPRILAILPPHHADPRLDYLVGEMGMAIVATSPNLLVPAGWESGDPYMAMSRSLMSAIFTTLPRRIPLIIEGCKKLNVDGVLNRFHIGCRFIAGDALLLESAINRELGIPVLTLEWESFDPRVYNHQEYTRRLEVFRSMMLQRAGR